MEKKKSVRTSLSLICSTMLHGAIITLVALGPSMIPGLNGKDGRQSSTIEFAVNEVSTPDAVAPVIAQSPAQPSTLADIRTVTVPPPKAKPVARAKKLESVTPTPVEETIEENKVEPQPIIAAQDGETPIAAEEITSDDKEPAAGEEQIAELDSTDENIESSEAEPTSAIATTSTGDVNSGSVGTGAENAGATGEAALSISTTTVTQDYTGLRQLAGNKPPAYTRDMRLKNLQGHGQLVYYVTKIGEVRDVRLTQSTGSTILDSAALEAFSKYKFVPGQEGYTIHNFEFALKGPAELDGGRLRSRAASTH
ncbi:MAG: hypothetical protein A2Z20_07625 [Bdellovibrionales bacterium RBG_16_40_8]|nr:MAG: hypothetical protein A2Z20_07625 [Bdellovibrionales bacterium RBG_16_40_8]